MDLLLTKPNDNGDKMKKLKITDLTTDQANEYWDIAKNIGVMSPDFKPAMNEFYKKHNLGKTK